MGGRATVSGVTTVEQIKTIISQEILVGTFPLFPLFVTGNTAKAREVFQKVTSGGGWNAFGFIAAEADLQRIK